MTDWRDRAACRDFDGDLFFLESEESENAAKAVCATCPVRSDCLTFALKNREYYGIWGGLNYEERRVRHVGEPASCAECGRTYQLANVAKGYPPKYCTRACHREARRRQWRDYKRRGSNGEYIDSGHGTFSRYNKDRCRCRACTSFMSAYNRKRYRDRQREEAS